MVNINNKTASRVKSCSNEVYNKPIAYFSDRTPVRVIKLQGKKKSENSEKIADCDVV